MSSTLLKSKLDSNALTALFNKLKSFYKTDSVDIEKKKLILDLVSKYGYLPYSFIKAHEELTPAETLIGIEEKLKQNNIYTENEFIFTQEEISPVKRAGFTNSEWIKTEQHNVKLINLAGLGNGNKSKEAGKFVDWLKQLLILPSGNLSNGVLGTTMYLIPFHPRDFGCAYLPLSSSVSPNLEDSDIKKSFNLDAKEQVQLFLTLTQLAGHPVMYDVLPQTGRFSKIVLTNPYAARWFDINDLIQKLDNDLNHIAENLKHEFHHGDVDYVKTLISKSLAGKDEFIHDHLKHIADRFEWELDQKRKWYSNEMLSKSHQEVLQVKIKNIIAKTINKTAIETIYEDDITDQNQVICSLIKSGLWPAPGGAWNSSGVPIFNKISNSGCHPLFKHYDFEGNDVSCFANLDCQTPYYFTYLESGEFNEEVIDFYVKFMKQLQADYNFDAFRVDHIDHIVDKYSENEQGRPISYRAPRYVLGKVNSEIKKRIPHFAVLAEYMLWEKFYKEYHQDMNFDLLWGNDIVSQYLKNVSEIISDNKDLQEYNSLISEGSSFLSILKTYNNQDGEFRAIDQYPGQLSANGALFKWFKFKFLPGGNKAKRPVMYIDGDESFTKTGIEKVIGSEVAMKRAKNNEFFRKFDAINRFALNNMLTRFGITELYYHNTGDGFVSWYIKKEAGFEDDERLLVAANENAPTEVYRLYHDDGNLELINKTGEAVFKKDLIIPEGFKAEHEYVLKKGSLDFEAVSKIKNLCENTIKYEKVEPSEFYIYSIRRI
jgi:hypothetical protein